MSLAPPPSGSPQSQPPSGAGSSVPSAQDTATILNQFNWKPQPDAWRLVNDLLTAFLAKCPGARDLSERMRSTTGTRFVDWVDTIELARTPELRDRMLKCGYELRSEPGCAQCYHNPLGIFPRIALKESGAVRVFVKVECVTDFILAHQLMDSTVLGEAGGQLRMAKAFEGTGTEMWVVERHAFTGYEPPVFDPAKAQRARQHSDRIRRRRRDFPDEICGFNALWVLLDDAIADIGRDWTCDIFFACEREYWMRRNRAAQIQHARQQELGLGWANHDHHTYRCSREYFQSLMQTWVKLGFAARERFYAGMEAGWGAQVMEQSTAGITTFNDVDLSPEELFSDFFNDSLAPQSHLKTVGLWCGLHGESIMQSGMHHLEAMFSHDLLVEQLAAGQVKTMAPFTTFSYLRQSFTEGERWPVSEARLERLLERMLITREQAAAFRKDGAIGSHLENLERNDGFKGFNQQGVSDIIARTDPRRLAGLSPA